MYSKKKQNKVRYKSIIVNINDIIKIKASNTQFKTDKTRSEERPARRRYVLQLNCMLSGLPFGQLGGNEHGFNNR